MTVYRFAGVEYLLGVNPAFAECADVKDEEIDSNKVDARWVDVQLVLYIDIMALSMHKDGGGSKFCSGRKMDMRIMGSMSHRCRGRRLWARGIRTSGELRGCCRRNTQRVH